MSKTWPALLSALLAASSARAEPHCDPDDVESCMQAVAVGEKAPFTGVLLTPRRAAIATVTAEQAARRTQQEVDLATKLLQIDLQAERDKRANDKSSFDDKLRSQRDAMDLYKQRFGPKWYDNDALWYGVGVVSALAMVLITVEVMEARRPNVVVAQ